MKPNLHFTPAKLSPLFSSAHRLRSEHQIYLQVLSSIAKFYVYKYHLFQSSAMPDISYLTFHSFHKDTKIIFRKSSHNITFQAMRTSSTLNKLPRWERYVWYLSIYLLSLSIFLNFSKVFDKVSHDRLLLILQSHEIDEKALSWIKVWLSRRK